MHNLGTVFRFELTRTLKKKSFWVMALAFPVIIGLVFAVIYFSNRATDKAANDAKNQHFSIEMTDPGRLVNPALISALHITTTTDSTTAIDDVKAGRVDAYIEIPQNITKEPVAIHAKDVGLFDNSRYSAVTQLLLTQSASLKTNPQTVYILQSKETVNTTTYKDGEVFDGWRQLIAPGVFLVLFYILISMFGNQMLTSTTEEKENRVIEMILTTIEARTLIIGKIFALIILALIQCVIILVPVIIAYLLFRDQLNLPNFDLSNIPIDPVRIGLGALIFCLSFLLFTGVLVAIGSAAPTAKEASQFFGMAMICIFGPLYAASLFISSPDSPIVTVLSFFPLTAPIPLMLRNAVGNLPVEQGLLGALVLAVSAVIALSVAVRLFRYGALEYSKRLSLSVIFKKRS